MGGGNLDLPENCTKFTKKNNSPGHECYTHVNSNLCVLKCKILVEVERNDRGTDSGSYFHVFFWFLPKVTVQSKNKKRVLENMGGVTQTLIQNHAYWPGVKDE